MANVGVIWETEECQMYSCEEQIKYYLTARLELTRKAGNEACILNRMS